MENMTYVTSASDRTLVIFVPEISLSKTWTKRGQRYPIPRETLVQAYYNPSVEYLFREGLLITDDKEFLKTVGLMTEEDETETVLLTEDLEIRMIKHMPLADFKINLAKLTHTQIVDLAEYAIHHYTDLKLDRAELLSKAAGKDILKAINNYKAAQEE